MQSVFKFVSVMMMAVCFCASVCAQSVAPPPGGGGGGGGELPPPPGGPGGGGSGGGLENITTAEQRVAIINVNLEISRYTGAANNIPDGYRTFSQAQMQIAYVDSQSERVRVLPTRISKRHDYISKLYRHPADGPIEHTPALNDSTYNFTQQELSNISDITECDARAALITARSNWLTAYNTMLSKQGTMFTQNFICTNWPYGANGRDLAIQSLSDKIGECEAAVADYKAKLKVMWNLHIDTMEALDAIEIRGDSILQNLRSEKDYYEFRGYDHCGIVPAPVWE